MKKTYIAPAVEVLKLQAVSMIAQSLMINSTGEGNGEVLVKGDRGGRGSRSDYNVWNDDWSQ